MRSFRNGSATFVLSDYTKIIPKKLLITQEKKIFDLALDIRLF